MKTLPRTEEILKKIRKIFRFRRKNLEKNLLDIPATVYAGFESGSLKTIGLNSIVAVAEALELDVDIILTPRKVAKMIEDVCSRCGNKFDLSDFVYIGPDDFSDDSCHPFMNIVNICPNCWTSEDQKKLNEVLKNKKDSE